MTPKPLLFTSTLPYTGRKGAVREKGEREDEKRKGGRKGGWEQEREIEKDVKGNNY